MENNISKKEKTLNAVILLNALFLTIALFCCCFVFATSSVFYSKLEAIACVIEITFSLYYSYLGYKKKGALTLRALFVFGAITIPVDYLFYYANLETFHATISPFAIIFSIICYGNLLLLGLGKDLGKKMSLTLASVNSIIYVIGTIITVYIMPSDMENIILYVSWILLSFACVLLIIGKYIDKESRGSK